MLHCYLLALASGSSVDQVSNNFSLFNLVEQLRVSDNLLGRELGIEAHIYWLVGEQARDKDFEVRVVRIGADGSEDAGAALPFRPAPTDRVRFRAGAFRLPNAYGNYLLVVEWRAKGNDDWHREHATWPLTVEKEPSTQPSAVPPATLEEAP